MSLPFMQEQVLNKNIQEINLKSQEISETDNKIIDYTIKELKLIANFSVRAENVCIGVGLDSLYKILDFYNKYKSFIKIRNCGSKTNKELINFCVKYKNILIDNSKTFVNININTLPNNIELIDYYFNRNIDKLSTRARNILIYIRNKSNNKEDFFKTLHIINNNPRRLRNAGDKTATEIKAYVGNIINMFDDSNNIDIEYENLILTIEDKFNLKITDYIENFNSLYKNKDLPLFKIIDVILKHSNCYDNVEKELIKTCYNSTIQTPSDIGGKFNLSRERIRQKKNNLNKKYFQYNGIISHLVRIVKDYIKIKEYEINFGDNVIIVNPNIIDNINSYNNTDFTNFFIVKIISLLDKNYFLINSFYKNQNIFQKIKKGDFKLRYNYIIKDQFDKASIIRFIDFIYNNIYVKREKDIIIDKFTLLNKFVHGYKKTFNNNIDVTINKEPNNKIYDEYIEIFNLILSKEFNLIFENDKVLLPRNAPKYKYEYLIEILREFKKPMHYSDIYKECKNRNIDFKNELGVHIKLQNHPAIFGLKGPGTYGLKECGGYFGSIGDVAEKYLKLKNCPVHLKELEEFLCSELIISQDSIREVLFNYDMEKRFERLKNGMVVLKDKQLKLSI